MDSFDDLRDRIETTSSAVSAGLDAGIDRLPDHLLGKDLPRWVFNRHIIDAAHEHAVALRPNVAFCEDEDSWRSLRETVAYAHGKSALVLLDTRRVDIGSTARKYANLLDDTDAITVNLYMGRDSIQPFPSREDKGVFVLRRTSNPGGVDPQSLEFDADEPLYERVATLCDPWSKHGSIGLVVGVTGPDGLEHFHEQVPDLLFLVPGMGAQGGDAEAAVEFSLADGVGLVNSSRGIIFAGGDDGEGFDRITGQAAKRLKNRLSQYR